jgi:hypothetical protein
MTRYFSALIVSLLIITGCVLQVPGHVHKTAIERAVTRFDQPVKLQGIILSGDYLFLHHAGLMARGKACTFVYALDQEKHGKFIVSFHCQPVTREKVDQFKVVTSSKGPFDLPEIEEIQFPGSPEGHRVHFTETVTIAPVAPVQVRR